MVERVEILTTAPQPCTLRRRGRRGQLHHAQLIRSIEVRAEAQKIQDTASNTPDMNLGLIVGGGNGTTHVVAGIDYATTEILLVEDRYEDARCALA